MGFVLRTDQNEIHEIVCSVGICNRFGSPRCKMKLFETVQKNVVVIGIYQIDDSKSVFNHRNLLFLFLYGSFTLSAAAFMLFDANTMQDYELSFFALLSLSFTFVDFFVFVKKAYRITHIVNRSEITINSRKSNRNQMLWLIFK